MTTRMHLKQAIPDGYRAVAGVEHYVCKTVPPRLLQLVNVRASIVNDCAYCVDLYSREALAGGESALPQHRHVYRVVGHDRAQHARGTPLAASASVGLGARARAG